MQNYKKNTTFIQIYIYYKNKESNGCWLLKKYL